MSRLHDLLDTVTEYVVVTVLGGVPTSVRGTFNGRAAAMAWIDEQDPGEEFHVFPVEEACDR